MSFFQRFFTEKCRFLTPQLFTCFKEKYSFHHLKKDFFSGISVGVIAVPIAIAASMGAGTPPASGLFTAIIAGLIVSIFGGSRVQIGGPSNTFIIIILMLVSKYGLDGMLMATLLAGIILIIFGIYGLGTYIKYIPYPVVTGFTMGITLLISLSQIKDFLGLQIDTLPSSTWQKITIYAENISTCNPSTVGVGVGVLIFLFYVRKLNPQFPKLLIALVLSALVVTVFQLDVETIGSRYGSLPHVLPHPRLPHLPLPDLIAIIPDAVSIALVVAIESLLSAVVSEGMTGWRHQSNCELVAQGLANVGVSLFGGMPASGSLIRTTVNVKCGAQTPLAGIIQACVTFAILFLFAPLASRIPLTALSAVLLVTCWNPTITNRFLHLLTAPKRDIMILLVVLCLTLFVNISAALEVGMIMAAFLFMKQMSDLSDVVLKAELIEETPIDPDLIDKRIVPEEVQIYELNGPFFFGVADRLKHLLDNLEHKPRIFILRMKKVPVIDASGMHALEEFFLECRKHRITLLLSGVKHAPLRDLKRYHLDQLIGIDHIFSQIDSALEFSKEMLRIEKFKRTAS